MILKKRKCPLCSGNEFTNIFNQKKPSSLTFVSCDKCDFIFQNPYIKLNDKNFYKERIYFGAINMSSQELIKRFNCTKQRIKNYFSSKKISILDYGCGNGSFLKYLKLNNFEDLTGFEFNIREEKNKRITFYNDLKCLKNSKKKFDVIVLNHVLEHIKDPVIKLTMIKKYFLKNNGKIFIEVPNYAIFENIGIKPGNLVKEHFSQFTTKSLYDCAIKSGLNVESIQTIDTLNESRDPFIPVIVAVMGTNENLITNSFIFKKKILKKEKIIKNFFGRTKKNTISIYGCGDGLDYLVSLININKIKYFFDGNKNIISKKKYGKTILEPGLIKKLIKKDIIIITSLSHKNIENITKKIFTLNPLVTIINFSRLT
jgi:SAM-dependent methyltransferase